MKTEDLVALLSTNTEPVDRRQIARTVCIALGAGFVVALGLMIAGLGVRTDLATVRASAFLVLKLAFAIGIVGLSSAYLTRLARPGGERTISWGLAGLPFIAVVLMALVNLGFVPKSHWNKMIMGEDWFECLLSIPIIAITPFAIVIWVVRQAAPTNLVRTGAFAGLVAGGLSAAAFALHCSDDSLPFVAVWYGGTIVLCALAGAIFGPRLLRW